MRENKRNSVAVHISGTKRTEARPPTPTPTPTPTTHESEARSRPWPSPPPLSSPIPPSPGKMLLRRWRAGCDGLGGRGSRAVITPQSVPSPSPSPSPGQPSPAQHAQRSTAQHSTVPVQCLSFSFPSLRGVLLVCIAFPVYCSTSVPILFGLRWKDMAPLFPSSSSFHRLGAAWCLPRLATPLAHLSICLSIPRPVSSR
jgi:hypothetical protein